MSPIIEYWHNKNKKRESYFNNKGKYHREDGPACQVWHVDGSIILKKYYRNGVLHREDGPAYENWDFDNYFYSYIIYGIEIKPEWFSEIGKDITKDFSDETIRNMILNIYGVSQ